LNRDSSLGSRNRLLRKGRLAFQASYGFTMIETMVALGMSAVVMYAITSLYLMVSTTTYDQKIQSATNLQVQALMQAIGSALRSLGNGVPFDQPRFDIGEEALVDLTVTDPISLDLTTANQVAFRLNETGDIYVLMSNFDPTLTSTVSLFSVDDLSVGDEIYINDSVVSGEDGLYGKIASINTGFKSVTLTTSTIIYHPPALFEKGAVLEPVPVIKYTSDLATKKVTRNSGGADVVMANNTTVTFSYLDGSGAAIALPLTRDSVIYSLRAIKVTIQADGEKKLASGETYTAVAQQTFALRNLNYNF
jgi:type II secretory pathway pseudopilin PulG